MFYNYVYLSEDEVDKTNNILFCIHIILLALDYGSMLALRLCGILHKH